MQTYTDNIVMSGVLVVIILDVLLQKMRANAHMSVTVGPWPQRCAIAKIKISTAENEGRT